jgi:tRNA 5-methylaminomethyl-2-thiouridine biosynthesis bifunctional protein
VKTEPIVPAVIEFAPGKAPRAPLFGDIYHPQAGALEQARHVFLAGNRLPRRWQGRERFVILETGFGLGNNFLATWHAWRADVQRCRRLDFVSIDKHPPRLADLRQALGDAPLRELADELIAAWPPLTPNVHVLDFDGGRVRLLLALGAIERLLPHLQLQADAFYLDGFAPARNPAMWTPRVLASLGRKAAPGATAASWSVARGLRDGLQSAGFELRRVPGFGAKRESLCASFQPHFRPRRAPAREPVARVGDQMAGQIADQMANQMAAGPAREALIIGGGLAGACAADALARQGWRCTVIDAHAEPAQCASGNPGGLFHGTAHADDGPHARFTRAAALFAARRYAPLIGNGALPGQANGLLRLRPAQFDPKLPADYLQALSSAAASALAGLPLEAAAWLYPGGGWVAPRELCRQLLNQDGIRFLGGSPVQRMQRQEDLWQVFDAQGQLLAAAPVLVLAGGASALPMGPVALPMPLRRVRGQVSWTAGPAPRRLGRPLSGDGYALTLPDGRLLFGASSQDDDDDPAVREADHAFNARRLASLCGIQLESAPRPAEPAVPRGDLSSPAEPDPVRSAPRPAEPAVPRGDLSSPAEPDLLRSTTALQGRTAWRSLAPDRLPLIGALPMPPGQWPADVRRDQCRFVPRLPGAFALLGLASRGLTWGPLAGEILAAWISGAPMPIEADLLDAVDPARAWVRQARRAAAHP